MTRGKSNNGNKSTNRTGTGGGGKPQPKGKGSQEFQTFIDNATFKQCVLPTTESRISQYDEMIKKGNHLLWHTKPPEMRYKSTSRRSTAEEGGISPQQVS